MTTAETPRVDLQDVLRSLGRDALLEEAEQYELIPRGGRFRCPFEACVQQGQTDRSVSIYMGASGVARCKCHRCSSGGSLVDLLMATRGWSQTEAIQHVLGRSTAPARPQLKVVRPELVDPDKLKPEQVASIWKSLATEPDAVTRAYLEHRGLGGAIGGGMLRFIPEATADSGLSYLRKTCHTIGALLSDVTGSPGGIQFRMCRQETAQDGKNSKIRSLKGSRAKGHWLGEPGLIEASDTVAVCEGLADTAAVTCWAPKSVAVVGAPGKDQLPGLASEIQNAGIDIDGKTFILFVQNDRPQNGSRRRFKVLAGALRTMGALVVMSSVPDEVKDVADWYREHRDAGWPPAAAVELWEQVSADEWPEVKEVTTGGGAIAIPEQYESSDSPGSDLASLLGLLDDAVERDSLFGRNADIVLNEMTHDVSISGKPFTERDADILRAKLCAFPTRDGKPLRFNREDILGAMSIIAGRNPQHPVREWLKSLRWDEEQRLDQQLPEALGVPAAPSMSALLLRRWMIGAVARVFRPGCQMDSMLVLQGAQYAGKTRFFRALGGEWHTDQGLRLDDKDSRLVLHQNWIIEWAELESLRRARDMEQVKAFITQTKDCIRPPYGRRVQDFKRSCVLCGSTNPEEFLRDPTGNRRFWVLKVKDNIEIQWIDEYRDQLWAEAVVQHHAGEVYHLTPEENKCLKELQEPHMEHDEWTLPVMTYVDSQREVRIADILSCGFEMPVGQWKRADEMRVAAVLRRAGWTSQQAGPHRIRTWFPPDKD